MGLHVLLNGSIVNKDKASAPIESDGLFYGAGCFETFKSYRGKFLHLDQHIQRLNNGIQYLTESEGIFYSERELRKEILNLLHANYLTNTHAKVRIQVSLGGRYGYTVSDNPKKNLIKLITADELPDESTQNLKLITSKTTVVPSSCRPTHLKLSNMLHYRQAAIEARQNGGDDAVMLTVDGAVAETSVANIFWESDGIVYTPSADCDILPGITSGVVIQLLEQLNFRYKKGKFSTEDVKNASQAWVCNSIKEFAWVSSIDDKTYSTKSNLQNELTHQFEMYKMKNLA